MLKPPDLSKPRTIAEVIGTALRLYTRYPLLFIALSMTVVVPYWVVVLLVTHGSPLGERNSSTGTVLTLELVYLALVAPTVSALQVRAVLMIGEQERPRFIDVIGRSLPVLPVVAAAEIVAGLGIGLGFVLLFFPGLYLLVRWAVVAQVAAIERTDWPTAIRRSGSLTRGSYQRIFGILFIVLVAIFGVSYGAGKAIGTGTTPAEVVIGIGLAVLESSFQALTTAVLYFDLRAREQAR